MWRTVAQLLAAHHTVIAADLRGYGKSDKPIADDPATYSKRTMGDDIVHITRSLGIHRFGVVGHDRGALVTVRAGLDHPEEITFLGILDVLPTLDTLAVLQGVHAKVAWRKRTLTRLSRSFANSTGVRANTTRATVPVNDSACKRAKRLKMSGPIRTSVTWKSIHSDASNRYCDVHA